VNNHAGGIPAAPGNAEKAIYGNRTQRFSKPGGDKGKKGSVPQSPRADQMETAQAPDTS